MPVTIRKKDGFQVRTKTFQTPFGSFEWQTIVRKHPSGYVRYALIPCPMCGKERWITPKFSADRSKRGYRHTMDCLKCSSSKKIAKHNAGRLVKYGSDHPLWKGGTLNDSGYRIVQISPDSPYLPMADKHRRIREHRLVMAHHLGRCLSLAEIVHHKNGCRTDNHIENLELFPDSPLHDSITKLQNYVKHLESRIADMERQWFYASQNHEN